MSKDNKTLLTHDQVLEETLKKARYQDADVEENRKAWETTKTLIPKEFDKLNSSEKCYFCIHEPKGETAAYANVILAHEEPLSLKRGLLGLGKKNVRSRIGSLIPAYIATCKRCKRVLRMIELIKWIVTVGISLITFAVLSLLIGNGIIEESRLIMPYAIALAGVILGYVLGKISSTVYSKEKSKEVHLNVFDLEILKEMKKGGWFLLQDDKASTSLNFAKSQGDFGRIFEK